MNKAELVSAMAEKAGLTNAQAKKALDALMETTVDTLKKGDKIAFVGFGTFSVCEKAARVGSNPHTGETINIAAKKVMKFKAGSGMEF